LMIQANISRWFRMRRERKRAQAADDQTATA